MNIIIVSGSPRPESLTRRVALHLLDRLTGMPGISAHLVDLQDHPLSQANDVITNADQAPTVMRSLTIEILKADAFVLVSPEYNGSYSPAMKMLLDHFPKQRHKVFGIVTASPGNLGGIRAAMQLQQLVYALFGIGSPYMLVVPGVETKFNTNNELTDDSLEPAIAQFLEEFLWLAERVTLIETAA
ncbi:MAG: NADPH-dependent oxidoreductase [Sphingobacteriales bacterium]|nr:MAG: NADPH-dependent oxidoreductase [Sphingobacteriales bacterium]